MGGSMEYVLHGGLDAPMGRALLGCLGRPIEKHCKLECGPMPNLMVALPNIGGALCSTP